MIYAACFVFVFKLRLVRADHTKLHVVVFVISPTFFFAGVPVAPGVASPGWYSEGHSLTRTDDASTSGALTLLSCADIHIILLFLTFLYFLSFSTVSFSQVSRVTRVFVSPCRLRKPRLDLL